MLKKTAQNQTQFADAAAFLTEPNLAEIDPEIAKQEEKKRKLIKKVLLLIGGLLVTLAFFVFLIVLFTPKKTKKKPKPTPTPTPKLEPIDQTLLIQAQQLKKELEMNDPIGNDQLLFPNVNENIYLDAPKRQ